MDAKFYSGKQKEKSFTPHHFSRFKARRELLTNKSGAFKGLPSTSKSGAGFTLVELLVVIAIIGLLSSVVLVSMQGTRQKANIAKAQQEVTAIHKAILLKEAKEEEYPHINNINSANDFKTYLTPYLASIGNDPWGNAYFYDGCPEPCTSCSGSGWDAGCEAGLWQSSVCSGGQTGGITSHNVAPNGDDICIYFSGGPSW